MAEVHPVTIFVGIILSITQAMGQIMRMAVSREREYRADAIACKLTRNPFSLVEALYIISRGYRKSLGEEFSSIFIMNPKESKLDEKEDFFSSLFSTHPPIKSRLNILLSIARTDLKAIEESTKPKKIEKNNAIIAIPKEREERWWTIGEDRRWVGPFFLEELSKIEWFSPDSWVKEEGSEKIVPAYEYKRLCILFKGRIKGKSSTSLCPHCHLELSEILYEGASIRRCSYCHGLLVEESKLSRVLAREEMGFSENVVRMAQMLINQKKLIKMEDYFEPKFFLNYPLCGQNMKRRFYSAIYPIEIDDCIHCHLIWFDKNELEVLQYMIEKKMEWS